MYLHPSLTLTGKRLAIDEESAVQSQLKTSGLPYVTLSLCLRVRFCHDHPVSSSLNENGRFSTAEHLHNIPTIYLTLLTMFVVWDVKHHKSITMLVAEANRVKPPAYVTFVTHIANATDKKNSI